MSTRTDRSVTTTAQGPSAVRYVFVAVLIVLAFFLSYRYALGRGADVPGTGPGTGGITQATFAEGSAAGGASCACCMNSGTGEEIEGAAVLGDDGIQRIEIDASAGYDPNIIKLAAGVPAEITFGKGSGCMAQVMSEELGFFEDLTRGPVTVSIGALAPGTYEFSCGMQMVFGSFVVE